MSIVATATNPKIKGLDELAVLVGELKAAGRQVVMSHGVFDLLHPGHIRHFEEAKRMGDVLVVTLTEDRFVNKGPHRPAFPQHLRAEAVAALGMVDHVAINRWPKSVETIQLIKPDIYVKGPDYKVAAKDITGGIAEESAAITGVGGEMRFTDDVTFSSSKLLNQYFSPFSAEVIGYLDDFKRRHSADEVLAWLDRASHVRPVVVGEAIVDEYVFCSGIGKSTKDPVLAVLQESIQVVAGGALAIANHLGGLCQGEVGLLSQVGDQDEYETLIRESLHANVKATLLRKQGTPTICKRRVVDRYSGNKLLEIYVMNDRPTEGSDARALGACLEAAAGGWDMTVVADYGHGMLSPGAIEQLCHTSKFLAVNVQSNAGNRGFNHISKYPRADYLCMANHEVALEMRRRDGDVRESLIELSKRVRCPRFTVTTGKEGSVYYDVAKGFTEGPALATTVKDRVGAGDAVLAVTSLLTHIGAPPDIVVFAGNVAGAELVAELGSRVPLERIALSKHVISLLK